MEISKVKEIFLHYSKMKLSFSETSLLEIQKKFYLSEVFYSVKRNLLKEIIQKLNEIFLQQNSTHTPKP